MEKLTFNIKKICKEKGFKLSDVAKKIGITAESLSRSINGNPQLSTLIEISNVLEVDIKTLFDDTSKIYGIVCFGNNTYIINNNEDYQKIGKNLEKCLVDTKI